MIGNDAFVNSLEGLKYRRINHRSKFVNYITIMLEIIKNKITDQETQRETERERDAERFF